MAFIFRLGREAAVDALTKHAAGGMRRKGRFILFEQGHVVLGQVGDLVNVLDRCVRAMGRNHTRRVGEHSPKHLVVALQ
jgi:hypothetical protein